MKPEREDLLKVVRSAIMAKQYGFEDILAELVVKAVLQITHEKDFNPDHVRVAKV